jgi:hypothetical protein
VFSRKRHISFDRGRAPSAPAQRIDSEGCWDIPSKKSPNHYALKLSSTKKAKEIFFKKIKPSKAL